jgi:putative ABC transport system permease protein
VIQDFRHACRTLAKSPGFSAASILTLALGIGANTAIFSTLNAMLLRPLPVRDAHDLVTVSSQDNRTVWPQRVWEEIRERQVLDDAFAWFWTRFDIAGRGERQFVDGIAISAHAFDTLGVEPAFGRLLTPADTGQADADPVVVISHSFWQRRFAGSADVLGRTITLDRRLYTIVGVTPRGFIGLNIGLPFDVAIALPREPPPRPEVAFSGPYVYVMGRLKRGQNVTAATAALRATQQTIRDNSSLFDVRPAAGGISFLQRRYERPFKALLWIVTFVLLIACGNIAMLMLARTIRQRHELAVRVALGASRGRLLRRSMAESAVLSAIGAACGLVLVPWCMDFVTASLSTQAYTVFLSSTPDWRVFAFAAAASVITTVLFGTLPALRATRVDAMDALKQRRATRGGAFGAGSAVMVVQIAVSMVLVVTAGLLLRTYMAIAAIDVGFEADRVLVAGVDIGRSGVTPQARLNLYERVAAAAEEITGVESAALSLEMPGGNMTRTPWIDLQDGTSLPQGPNGVYEHRVSARWFEALGTRIVAGRGFEEYDRAGAPTVAVINETFARRFLKGSPLGQTIYERNQPDGPRQPMEIVGVVEDAMYRLLKESPPPTVYKAMAQMEGVLRTSVNLSIRHQEPNTAALSRRLADAIGRVDPEVSVIFRTLSDQVDAQYAQERLVAAVAGFFGALALLLAGVGLYGVTAYIVSGRSFEVGIRIALGAAPMSVVRLLFARVTVLVFVGIAIGVVGSAWAGRLIESMLYGVEPHDGMTFWVAAATVIATTVLAAALPARRAASVAPASILRSE